MSPKIHSTDAEWTVDTLRIYLTDAIEGQDRRHTEQLETLRTTMSENFLSSKDAVAFALSAAKEAVTKSETANEKRFENVNEFRETLADQQRTLMPRIEAENRLTAMGEKVDQSVKTMGEKIELIRMDISNLRESRSVIQGHAEQKTQSITNNQWGIATAIVGTGVVMTIILGAVEIVLRLSGH